MSAPFDFAAPPPLPARAGRFGGFDPPLEAVERTPLFFASGTPEISSPFGTATVLQLHAQAGQIGLPAQLLSAVPYVATILALVLLSIWRGRAVGAPGSLGAPFVPDR